MTPRQTTRQCQALALVRMLLLLLLPWRTQAAITCTAITTRINTTVTCHFGVDISKSEHSFNVQFYYPDLKATPRTVLGCNFIEGGGLACHEGEGITFDRQISDHIRVIGPPANQDRVGGHYTCQVVPALPDGKIKSCKLTFKDIPTEPPTTPNVHPHLSETDDKDRTFALHIVIVVLLLAILGVLLVYVILHWNPVRGRCQRSLEHQDQEAGDTQEPSQEKSDILSCFRKPRTTEAGSDEPRQKAGCCGFCTKPDAQDKREKPGEAKESEPLTEMAEFNQSTEEEKECRLFL